MAKIPVDDSEEFAKWMLGEFDVDGETIMVAPGPGFYSTPGNGKQEIRIAYVLGEVCSVSTNYPQFQNN